MHDIGLIAIALTGITFTVSTSNGADRHDENFYDTLHNRVLRGWVSDE